ncbi:MAG: hypothetical protein ACWGQW_24680, partial [bacterium]
MQNVESKTRNPGPRLVLIGFLCFSSFLGPRLIGQELPRPVVPYSEEVLGRESLNHYGTMEETIQMMRAYRKLDLNAEIWRNTNPDQTYSEWAELARDCVAAGLHYEPGPLNLDAETLSRIETDSFIRETVEFNTTPWFRVPGYFYIPKNVPLPAPALVVLHEWGGPMLFGADRVSGAPIHEAVVRHRARTTSGRALADWYASNGYAVIVI